MATADTAVVRGAPSSYTFLGASETPKLVEHHIAALTIEYSNVSH